MWPAARLTRYTGLTGRRRLAPTRAATPSCCCCSSVLADRSKFQLRAACWSGRALGAGAAVLAAGAHAATREPVSLEDSSTRTKEPLPLSQHHRQLALNLLELLDQNHDGTLTFKELLKLTAMTEPHWSDGRRQGKANALMVAMDKDGDGTVSKDEFLVYVQHQYETFAERRHLFSVVGHLEELNQISQGRREDRAATTIVQQHEIGHIASLVNAVVDLEFFDEDQEQEIFEDAVIQVLQVLDCVLPHPYKQLVVASSDAAGLPDHMAEELKFRLETYIEHNLKLPCLEEPEERRVRMAVVEIIVEAMKSNTSLSDVSDAHKSGPIIMGIFVRGAIGMLRPGSDQRDGVVATVAENVSIPFFPVWLTRRFVEFILEKVELVVEAGIQNTFDTQVRTAKQIIRAAEMSAASPEHNSTHSRERRVDAALQDHLQTAFAKEQFHLEVQQEMVDLLYPHVAHLPLPDTTKRKLSAIFVEHIVLNIVDLDRLADAMKYVVSQQHVETAFEERNVLLPG